MILENPDTILLDVRSRGEYKEGHLNGALIIPNYELESKIRQIVNDKNTGIIVYCKGEGRSIQAINTLERLRIYKIILPKRWA